MFWEAIRAERGRDRAMGVLAIVFVPRMCVGTGSKGAEGGVRLEKQSRPLRGERGLWAGGHFCLNIF